MTGGGGEAKWLVVDVHSFPDSTWIPARHSGCKGRPIERTLSTCDHAKVKSAHGRLRITVSGKITDGQTGFLAVLPTTLPAPDRLTFFFIYTNPNLCGFWFSVGNRRFPVVMCVNDNKFINHIDKLATLIYVYSVETANKDLVINLY